MQLPKRKPGKYTYLPFDPVMTEQKYTELKTALEQLKKKKPLAAAEVARLAELGDFSENVEYQQAKRRLRGILSAIAKIEFQLNSAEIITQGNSDIVEIGSTVTVRIDGTEKTYTILGSSETNPQKNIISYSSPLGSSLLGNRVGDIATLSRKQKGKLKHVTYTILHIST